MLLLAQFVIGIIIFVIGSPWYLTVVSWIAWIVTHLLIWVYLFSLNERYASNPPLKVVEFYFHVGAALLYGLCSMICLFTLSWLVGVFAVINTVAYAGAAIFLFSDWTTHRSALPK